MSGQGPFFKSHLQKEQPPPTQMNMKISSMAHFPQFRISHLLFLWIVFITLVSSSSQSQQTPPPIANTDPSYNYNLCAPSLCNNITLRYPFGFSTPCHIWPRKAICQDNKTFHWSSLRSNPHDSDTFRILATNYTDPATVSATIASDSLLTCGAQTSRPNYRNYGTTFSLPGTYAIGTHFNCTAPIPRNLIIQGLQNASCIGCDGQDPSNVCYYAPGTLLRAPNCETFDVFSLGGPLNATSLRNIRAFLRLGYELKYSKTMECLGCEVSGGRCGANPSSGTFICFCPSSAHQMNCTDGMIEDLSTWLSGPRRKKYGLSRPVLVGICTAASALIVGLLSMILVMIFRRPKHNVIFSKRTISGISPSRYSYSQLKKFTNNFCSKLGEGGFGSVYKGTMMRSGLEIHVAIKLLKRSGHTKKQFMNEVATLGSIHHQNLVSLLGYCVEGENHALVYEFMENGSLDRYIYNITGKKDGGTATRKFNDKRLSFEQVYNIGLETARGILYLHKGCSKKILHSDIKPPNILLDSNFSAKVSDFGLARMAETDQSHFSLTQAQGTPGYAAPEMWLKFHGPVTEKSDVYGYGMLILEMIGGRKNYDVEASGSSQVYFPEWLYERIDKKELPLGIRKRDCNDYLENTCDQEGKIVEDDEMAMQRMCLVGLWCIQHIPSNRPSMDKVVQRLEGHTDIALPPYPFPQNTTKPDGVMQSH